MSSYYSDNLGAHKLMQVYDTDIPRVKQYLSAEIDYIISYLDCNKTVLEFGAGYGRILRDLAPHAKLVEGFDISETSVEAGREYLKKHPNTFLFQADVHQIQPEKTYDVVLCAQNGLSAMKGEAALVVQKAVSMLNPGGTALFSSYSPSFWAYRLAWFQEQADKGLIGQLDFDKSIHGRIVCKDEFTATTHTEDDFKGLAAQFTYPFIIKEIDNSSLFLAITKA